MAAKKISYPASDSQALTKHHLARFAKRAGLIRACILWLAFLTCAHASDAPSLRPSPSLHHGFFDRQNSALIIAGFALRAGDVWTTKRFLERGGRERVMPEALVQNTTAFAAYSAGAAAGTVGLAWLAHRARHHRIERAILWVHVGFMAGLVVNNEMYVRRLPHGD